MSKKRESLNVPQWLKYSKKNKGPKKCSIQHANRIPRDLKGKHRIVTNQKKFEKMMIQINDMLKSMPASNEKTKLVKRYNSIKNYSKKCTVSDSLLKRVRALKLLSKKQFEKCPMPITRLKRKRISDDDKLPSTKRTKIQRGVKRKLISENLPSIKRAKIERGAKRKLNDDNQMGLKKRRTNSFKSFACDFKAIAIKYV